MIVGLTWTGRALLPLDDADLVVLSRSYAAGEVVRIDVKKARHLKHHKRFFALLNDAIEAGAYIDTGVEDIGIVSFHDPEALRYWCFVAIGFSLKIRRRKRVIEVPKSISFDSLDEHAFSDVYDRSIVWLADNLRAPPPSIIEEADDIRSRQQRSRAW